MRGDGRVDADDLAVQVDEWSAARAGVDGGVGLEKVLDADGGSQTNLAALAGADDAVRDRLIEPKRAADGQYPLTDPGGVAIAQGGRGQVAGGRQRQNGDVGLRVGPDAGGVEEPAVRQVDSDLFRQRLRDDVVIGQHQRLALAGKADEHARAGFLYGVGLAAGRFRRLGGLNVDHRRRHPAGDDLEAVAQPENVTDGGGHGVRAGSLGRRTGFQRRPKPHGNPAAKGSTDAEEHEEDKAFEHGYLHSDVRKSAGGHSASRRTKAILPAPAAGLEKMRREVRRSCRIVPA